MVTLSPYSILFALVNALVIYYDNVAYSRDELFAGGHRHACIYMYLYIYLYYMGYAHEHH